MKHNHLFLALLAMGFVSCVPDRSEDKLQSLAIYDYSITGKSPLGTYEISEYGVDKASDSFRITVRPQEFDYAPDGSANVDALWMSVTYGELYNTASAEEAFTYERITERNRQLVDKFEQYRRQLIDEGTFNDKSTRASFINVYVKGEASIIADGALFGQSAGTDLSKWFRFGDGCIIGVNGTDYKMVERANYVNEYQLISDYFTSDKMLPLQIKLCTTSIPEEVSLAELPVVRYVGDDIIKVNITVPVCFERYWDWCKALYSDSNAEEQFVDGEIRIMIPFVKKP